MFLNHYLFIFVYPVALGMSSPLVYNQQQSGNLNLHVGVKDFVFLADRGSDDGDDPDYSIDYYFDKETICITTSTAKTPTVESTAMSESTSSESTAMSEITSSESTSSESTSSESTVMSESTNSESTMSKSTTTGTTPETTEVTTPNTNVTVSETPKPECADTSINIYITCENEDYSKHKTGENFFVINDETSKENLQQLWRLLCKRGIIPDTKECLL